MIMKPYSEVLNRYFDTEEDCLAEEKAFKEKEAKDKELKEKKKEAAEILRKEKDNVVEAYRTADNMYKDYKEHIKQFNETYKEPYRTVEKVYNIDTFIDDMLKIFSIF